MPRSRTAHRWPWSLVKFVLGEAGLFLFFGLLTLYGVLPETVVAALLGPELTAYVRGGAPGLLSQDALRWAFLVIGLSGMGYAGHRGLARIREIATARAAAPSLAEIAARADSRRPEGEAPLSIHFAAADEAGPFGSGLVRRVLTPQGRPASGTPEYVIVTRILFHVRNDSPRTIHDVSASVRAFDHPRHPDLFTRARVPLPTTGDHDGPAKRASVSPGDAVPFVLLEVVDIERGGATGVFCEVDEQELATARSGSALELFVGGIGNGHAVTRGDGIRIGIAVHGRDAPPCYGWFTVDLYKRFHASFEPVASVGDREPFTPHGAKALD